MARVGGLALCAVLTTSLGGCALVARPAHRAVASPPSELGARNVAFASASGNEIRGWFSLGQPDRGAVLLLHGIGENRTAMLDRARFLHRAGFSVLLLDFEGHGESAGDKTTYGARESMDAAAALAFLRSLVPNQRIGVIGVSMGGAAAVLGKSPLAADAFVLESVYPTIRKAVENRLATWTGPLRGAARLFTSLVVSSISSKTGVRERELEPIARIGHLQAPVLLITGSMDPYTPLAEAESLYARAPQPKDLWIVDGAGHEDLHAYARREYERRVGRFLTEQLSRRQVTAFQGAQ